MLKTKYLDEYLDNLITVFKDESEAYNYHNWFKNNCTKFTLLNMDESIKLSKHAKIKRCYDNCLKLAYKNLDLKYVEGYVFSLIPIEHAFLINNNNEVIDPTLALLINNHNNVMGSEYFGIEIPTNLLFKLQNKTKSSYINLGFEYYKLMNKKGEYAK